MRLGAVACPLIWSLFFSSRPTNAVPLQVYSPDGNTDFVPSIVRGPGETHVSTKAGPMGKYYMKTVDDLSSDIKVYNARGEGMYTISSKDRFGEKVEHGFQVLSSRGSVLLEAHDTWKALCHFGYTYNSLDSSVSYGIETKGTNPDQWKVSFHGGQESLIYHRGKSQNVGAITLSDDEVATISLSKPQQEIPWQVKEYGKQTDLFCIDVKTPNYNVEYFIGLVVMAAKRMNRCGK